MHDREACDTSRHISYIQIEHSGQICLGSPFIVLISEYGCTTDISIMSALEVLSVSQ